MSDFKSNEYANLMAENTEPGLMMVSGCPLLQRFFYKRFALECEAMRKK
jgi:hypothetical protein